MHKQGYSPEEITAELPVALAQAHAGLAHYHFNVDETEADTRADSEEGLAERHGKTVNG